MVRRPIRCWILDEVYVDVSGKGLKNSDVRHSPPELGGEAARRRRRGGPEREPDRAKHRELFKVPRSGSLQMPVNRSLLIGTVRL